MVKTSPEVAQYRAGIKKIMEPVALIMRRADSFGTAPPCKAPLLLSRLPEIIVVELYAGRATYTQAWLRHAAKYNLVAVFCVDMAGAGQAVLDKFKPLSGSVVREWVQCDVRDGAKMQELHSVIMGVQNTHPDAIIFAHMSPCCKEHSTAKTTGARNPFPALAALACAFAFVTRLTPHWTCENPASSALYHYEFFDHLLRHLVPLNQCALVSRTTAPGEGALPPKATFISCGTPLLAKCLQNHNRGAYLLCLGNQCHCYDHGYSRHFAHVNDTPSAAARAEFPKLLCDMMVHQLATCYRPCLVGDKLQGAFQCHGAEQHLPSPVQVAECIPVLKEDDCVAVLDEQRKPAFLGRVTKVVRGSQEWLKEPMIKWYKDEPPRTPAYTGLRLGAPLVLLTEAEVQGLFV